MGLDFYPCSRCGEIYCDCGEYVTCNEDAGGCGRDWCGEECAEQDGYVKCYCKLGKELERDGYYNEGCDKYSDETDSCSSVECEYFVEASCSYCRNEKFDDNEILEYALSLLNKTKKEIIGEMRIK